MARGYPDFFGFSVFPFYGETLIEQVVGYQVLATERTTLFELTHKGIMAGGWIYNYIVVASATFGRWYVTIDGEEMQSPTLIAMLTRGLDRSSAWPMYCSEWSIGDTYRTATWLFLEGLSWGYQFKLEYHNTAPVAVARGNYDFLWHRVK